MKVLCPHCNYEYPDISENLRNQIVLCANCNEEFVADDGNNVTSIADLNQKAKSKAKKQTLTETIEKKEPQKKSKKAPEKIKNSSTCSLLRILAIISFACAILTIFFVNIVAGLSAFFVPVLLLSFARIIYLLEFICNNLNQNKDAC